MTNRVVAIRGGGDLGSGVALRLKRCGFHVALLESEAPVAVRRTVSFAEAVYDGVARVEDTRGALVSRDELEMWDWDGDRVPVLVDPEASWLRSVRASAVVDAILAKRNTGTTRDMADCVVGLGPGFRAGDDVHAVVETNRGPDLGRVIWSGTSEANTGSPAPVMGFAQERVLRAPASGTLRVTRDIPTIVEKGELVAEVSGAPVLAQVRGVVRGMARDGLTVSRGMKIGDIDPRLDSTLCYRVSDKSLAIAGGVLEAILAHRQRHTT